MINPNVKSREERHRGSKILVKSIIKANTLSLDKSGVHLKRPTTTH